ncbi:cache domain-containing sensor histidine kinase [Cohnella hongkongensis]|uniref:histidine kinase n=1 Tax=Cohnella hongkongensis TaxID=178337 RepID=A0ABV9FC25_9BACL
MASWADWRLKNKISAALSVVFLISLIVIGTLVYLKMSKDYKNRTEDLMDTTIRQMIKTVDVHMTNIERLSISMLSDPIIQRVLNKPSVLGSQEDVNELNYRMLLLSSPWPFIQGVYIYAEDGRVFSLSNGDSPRPGFSVREEPWYEVMSGNGAPVLLYMPTGRETTPMLKPRQVFSLVRPINDVESGKRLAFMKLDLQIELFQAVIGNEYPLDKKIAPRYVVLQDRHVMFDNRGQLTGRELDADALEGLADSSGILQWDGERYLYAAASSSNTKWRTVSILPYTEAIKESIKIRNMLMWLGAVFLVIVSACSYYLVSGMIKPLSRVMVSMKRVEMGDFKVRLLEKGNRDEISQLSRIFNIMLESVDHLFHRVYQSELREKDSQLQALQAQINPHMLFNTLNIMKALCRKRGLADVSLMIGSLADLFRYSLKDWKRTVSLGEELDYIQNYMRIQELRFSDKLIFRCHVPEPLLACRIARLTLQPLVENAVIYGVEQSLEACAVEIRAERGIVRSESEGLDLRAILIEVSDTGPGISEERLADLRSRLEKSPEDESPNSRNGKAEGLGIGLVNVQRRVRLLFGEPFGIRVDGAPDRGFRVRLAVPDDTIRLDQEEQPS